MKDCTHKTFIEETGETVCALSICDKDDVDLCCPTCDMYDGPSRGVGDVVKRATSAVGIKPCGGCQKRREMLNRMMPFKDKDKDKT